MKIIVTHLSVDLDAVTSIWLIKRFLPGWDSASYDFVPAGEKLPGRYLRKGGVVEHVYENEVIHVDTGMGLLDHHHLEDNNVCAASITLDYVLNENKDLVSKKDKVHALREMVNVVIDNDHFQEVYLPNPQSYLHDFSLVAIIDGLKMVYPKDDLTVVELVSTCLDSILRVFENRFAAEQDLQVGSKEFKTAWGSAIALESANDAVMKIAQKKGYVIVLRRDPKSGSIRIKARPSKRSGSTNSARSEKIEDVDIDLSSVYRKLKKADPQATWFLHASKRMILNGSSKNPNSTPSILSVDEVIKILS